MTTYNKDTRMADKYDKVSIDDTGFEPPAPHTLSPERQRLGKQRVKVWRLWVKKDAQITLKYHSNREKLIESRAANPMPPLPNSGDYLSTRM